MHYSETVTVLRRKYAKFGLIAKRRTVISSMASIDSDSRDSRHSEEDLVFGLLAK